MRILVTNDDGVRAPGIAILALALADAGFDVIVAAPLNEASGAGAGVGPVHLFRDGIHIEALELPELPGIETLGVDALPALAVIAACMGAFGPPPDVVVAGINPGRNLGRAVMHSGTVGAALTASNFGRRGLAMSIQTKAAQGVDRVHFGTAAALAVTLVPLIAGAAERTVLNCNVPNLPLTELRGLRRAHLARSGLVRSALADGDGPRIQLELGTVESPPDGDSDEALTASGYATVTPLVAVAEDETPQTDAFLTEAVRAWARRSGPG